MIGKIFWFLIGAGVAIYVARKLREYFRKASPDAIGNQVASSVRDFTGTMRAAMAEREAELRDALGLPES